MRAVEAARWLLEVLGSSTSLSWRFRELPKSRSSGPVGVWRVFYVSGRLWEAQLYVFYVSGRLSGGRMFNEA